MISLIVLAAYDIPKCRPVQMLAIRLLGLHSFIHDRGIYETIQRHTTAQTNT